jgi:hypothetical protein
VVSFKDKFDPTWAGYPPHMAKEDYQIFQRGKAIIFADAINVFYDAGLGGAKELPEDMEESLKSMWTSVTQKRIDVLIETNSLWKIVEIRPRATSTAAGRLLQYKDMWNADPPDNRPVRLVLLTDVPDPDLPSLLKSLDIELITA